LTGFPAPLILITMSQMEEKLAVAPFPDVLCAPGSAR